MPIFWQMNQNQVRHPGALLTLIQQTTNLFPPNVNHMAGDVLVFFLDPNNGRVDTHPGSLVQVASRHTCQICPVANTTPFSYVLRIAISDSPVPINLDQLVNHRMANPLVFDCTSCQSVGQVQDTVVTVPGTGRLGGRFLIVEIDRLSLGVGNQIVRRQLNFARAPNSPLLEPVFVIGQQPGHWICFARHRMNNSWFRMNDSAMPVPADPFQTQGGNYLMNYVVFSVN